MLNRIKITAGSLVIMLLLSCSGTTRKIDAAKLPGGARYVRNSYAGCCGCQAKYFNIYRESRLQEQVVYSYNCYNPGMPTKFIFHYDAEDAVLYCNRYIATIANDQEQALNEDEKKIFGDLVRGNEFLLLNNKRINYAEITGFRELREGETGQAFPLGKGYVGVTIR